MKPLLFAVVSVTIFVSAYLFLDRIFVVAVENITELPKVLSFDYYLCSSLLLHI